MHFYSDATGLVTSQNELELLYKGETFRGLSMVDTIFKLIKMNEETKAEKLMTQYFVPLKKYALIKIRYPSLIS